MAGLLALHRERKAPGHRLQHPPAVLLAHHHSGPARIDVPLGDIEQRRHLGLKWAAISAALFLLV
jgi:hypothetical protein